MHIRRETDPQFLERVANSDAVRPFMGIEDDQPDWATIAKLQAMEAEHEGASLGLTVLSNGEDGFVLMTQTCSGVHQAHTFFDRTCRGRKAIETGKAIIEWMFDHGAYVVWGCTPMENAKARWFNRQIGMTRLDTSDDEDEVYEIRRAA